MGANASATTFCALTSVFQQPARGRDRAPARLPERSQDHILQHNRWHAAFLLQNFHRNSPCGRRGEHPPQGRWEDDVENFQYNQELCGAFLRVRFTVRPFSTHCGRPYFSRADAHVARERSCKDSTFDFTGRRNALMTCLVFSGFGFKRKSKEEGRRALVEHSLARCGEPWLAKRSCGTISAADG
jgi:hypothetical protein